MRVEYKYDGETLKHLQSVELEMLKVFDAICMKHGIEYFVGFGTAIGAIRHQGFIPWDDDIDVCMMRDEYRKLQAVPKEEWRGLELSEPLDGYEAHTLVYPQIYKPGTIFETEYHNSYDEFKGGQNVEKHPIWLDIFLFDRVDSPEQIEKKKKKAFFLQKLFYYSKSRIKILPKDSLGRKVSCLGKRAIHDVLNIWNNPSERVYAKYIKHVGGSNGEYVTSFDLERLEQMTLCCEKYSEMFPTVRVPFEDIEVSIQKNYDAALTRQYGDYMSMPPIEKRYNHPPKILDFGDGLGNVIK